MTTTPTLLISLFILNATGLRGHESVFLT